MPEQREDLAGAVWDPTAHAWIVGEKSGLILAVIPFAFTSAVVVGKLTLASYYTDRWCYHTPEAAIAAALVWTGEYPDTEPDGWHRHPLTGRRRDPAAGTEWVAP